MKVAFISRSTIYKTPGGDTIQMEQTAGHLRLLGVDVDICPTSAKIDYSAYDLFHFFNLTRPADILYHYSKITAPVVLTPILVDYSEYDAHHRQGLSGFFFRRFTPETNEYLKTVLRAMTGKDVLRSKKYLYKGHLKSIKEVLQKAKVLLPNSDTESKTLKEKYKTANTCIVVPNGVDTSLFEQADDTKRDEKLVVCAARIEGIKNQLNLIRALNNTPYTLLLIGAAAPNQKSYYKVCRKAAASNIRFIGRVPQDELAGYYAKAKVHVLPSWFETCGLSSLEAVAMGCNIVITDRGYTRSYFGNSAFYCEPQDPESIYNAIEKAATTTVDKELQQKIVENFSWKRAAAITLEAYKKVLEG